MIGRLHHVILDCPDPLALARFYSDLLGQPVSFESADFCVVSVDERTSGLGFQLAPDHVAPTWPHAGVPQQVHLDVMVDDVESAGRRVQELGARPLELPSVFADPAGHPFCLIPRPHWAAPIEVVD